MANINITSGRDYQLGTPESNSLDVLRLVRQWLDQIEILHPWLARFLCKIVPAQCPFERNVQLWGHTFHIPALCKLNPLYEQLVGIRFRALTFLADRCMEDVSEYCR